MFVELRDLLVEFVIDKLESLDVTDRDILDLLSEVYVQGGYTDPEVANAFFDPVKVKNRGIMFACIEKNTNKLSGMVIVVPGGSKASVIASSNECEMHLLGVSPKYRGNGLGRKLVSTAIDCMTHNQWQKMVLWTQKSMKEAHNLYESFGFTQCRQMSRNGIDFIVYEKRGA